jgi:hypothetical protein
MNSIIPEQSVRMGGWLVVGAVAVLLAGCSADAGVGVGGGSTDARDGLGGAVTSGTAPFLVLDLAAGTTATYDTLPTLTSDATYASTAMVFRRVTAGGSTAWVGAFEVTQAQWRLIAGSSNQPWTNVATAVVGTDAVGDARPAFNLSFTAVQNAVTGYRTAHAITLALPTPTLWHAACAAGSSGTWAWGDAHDRGTLAAYAVVRETLGITIGPKVVGGRQPNAFGLYDMHGNVWEWTATGTTISGAAICGGSWSDTAIQARTAQEIEADTHALSDDSTHALIGARLVYTP